MGLQSIFRNARRLGDLSALERENYAQRLVSRSVGKAASGPMRGLSMHNMVLWGAFLGFINNQMKLKRALMYEDGVWVVNVMRYAYGYENGFTTVASGGRIGPPGYGFFQRGLERGLKGSWQPYKGGISFNRSGLYVGGRFAADVRAIAKGKIAQRAVRRYSGRQFTRLFWGTMANKDANPMDSLAESCVREIRKNIRGVPLFDTGALTMATQWGTSKSDAVNKSREKAEYRLSTFPSRHASYTRIESQASLFKRKIAEI